MAAIQAYTIVDRRTSEPFALRIRQRAAMVAFRTYPNALLTARAVESAELHRETMSEAYDLLPAEFSLDPPANLFIQAWESYEALLEFGACNDMDVMYCESLDARPGESIEFNGHVQSTSPDP